MNFVYGSDPCIMYTRTPLANIASEINFRDFCLEIFYTYLGDDRPKDVTGMRKYKKMVEFIEMFVDVLKDDIAVNKADYTGRRIFDMDIEVPIIAPIADVIQDRLFAISLDPYGGSKIKDYSILIISAESAKPDGRVAEAPMIRADLYSINGFIRRYMQTGRIN